MTRENIHRLTAIKLESNMISSGIFQPYFQSVIYTEEGKCMESECIKNSFSTGSFT